MSQPIWSIEGQRARLAAAGIDARVDLARPADGLHAVSVDGRPMAVDTLLGLLLPAVEPQRAAEIEDAHVRGGDLVIGYGSSVEWPIEAEAVWRRLDGARLGLELVVSVRTPFLDSRPELVVIGRCPSGAILGLADVGFRPLTWLAEGTALVEKPRPGCLVVRLGDGRLWAEMVHPGDFQYTRLARDVDGAIGWMHHLFPEPLEKGVILRGRVRGYLLAGDDADAALALYNEFAASPPPIDAF